MKAWLSSADIRSLSVRWAASSHRDHKCPKSPASSRLHVIALTDFADHPGCQSFIYLGTEIPVDHSIPETLRIWITGTFGRHLCGVLQQPAPGVPDAHPNGK